MPDVDSVVLGRWSLTRTTQLPSGALVFSFFWEGFPFCGQPPNRKMPLLSMKIHWGLMTWVLLCARHWVPGVAITPAPHVCSSWLIEAREIWPPPARHAFWCPKTGPLLRTQFSKNHGNGQEELGLPAACKGHLLPYLEFWKEDNF